MIVDALTIRRNMATPDRQTYRPPTRYRASAAYFVIAWSSPSAATGS
jgi:hypothetical protein